MTFSGEASGSDATLQLTPEYSQCGVLNAEGELANSFVTTEMNGCAYELERPSQLKVSEFTGGLALACPEGGPGPLIHIYANNAHTIKIRDIELEPGQGELAHVLYHVKGNGEEPDDITAEATVEGIKYNKLSTTCPEGKGTAENGALHAKITLSAEGHDLWLDG